MPTSRPLLKRFTAALLALTPWIAPAETVQVAVAANFAEPIKAIADEWQRASGHTLNATVGATGKLYAQIRNGAPFDVFLAANAQVPETLEAEGLAQPGSRFTYARGQLVLWSANARRVDAQGDVLRRADLGKLAYANPKTAPYGAAAVQLMAALGLTEALTPKLVQGESIGQTYAFVFTGNADVGFVALSQIFKNGQLKSGSMWRPPGNLYAPIEQDAVLLKRGANNPAARAFMQWLKSPEGQTLIRTYGYDI
nr:molybdate ABC transporter substrate-binding protein [Hydrogenophaga crassostreae]